MPHVFVLMSTNHEAEKNLRLCFALFQKMCQVKQVSRVYETAPVGELYQDNFLDAVVELETDLDPVAFREQILGEIEQELGRDRTQPKIAPMKIPIDLDILLWDNASFDFGDKPWHVPDKGILAEIHLARPLAELAPDYVHPENGRTLRDIAADLSPMGLQLRAEITLQ